MLPTEGGKHFFKKMDKLMKERVCRARKAQRKQQMACEFHKIASAVHTILFADWALEAKNAQFTGHSETFDRLMERKNTEPNEQRSDRKGQSDENSRFALLLAVQTVVFLMQNGVGRSSKMCLLLRRGSLFSKKRVKIMHVAENWTRKP